MINRFDCLCDRWTPLIGRILIASLFIIAGVGKVLNGAFPGTVADVALGFGGALASLATTLAIGAIIIELGGGILLALGYKTRLVAWVLVAFVTLANLGWHPVWADPNQMVMFLKNLAIIGGLLYVAGYGAGKVSLDNKHATSASGTCSLPQESAE